MCILCLINVINKLHSDTSITSQYVRCWISFTINDLVDVSFWIDKVLIIIEPVIVTGNVEWSYAKGLTIFSCCDGFLYFNICFCVLIAGRTSGYQRFIFWIALTLDIFYLLHKITKRVSETSLLHLHILYASWPNQFSLDLN